MSRTTLAIEMLSILSTNSVVSRSELAQRLEVKIRYVSLLREELITAGYDIQTIYGKNGGYKLNTNNTVPIIDQGLHKNLTYMLDYIKKRDIFVYKDKFVESLEKIMSRHPATNDLEKLPYDYIRSEIYRKKTVDKFNMILSNLMDSAINKKQIKIQYYDHNLNFKSEIFQVDYITEHRGKWFINGLVKQDIHWYTESIKLESIYNVEVLSKNSINLNCEKIKTNRLKHFVVIDFSNLSNKLLIEKLGFIYEYVSIDKSVVKFWVDDIFSLHILQSKIGTELRIIDHNLF